MTDAESPDRTCSACGFVEVSPSRETCDWCGSALPAVRPAAPTAPEVRVVPLGQIDDDPWADGPPVVRRLRIAEPGPELMLDVSPGEGVLLGREAPSPIAGHPAVSKFVSARHARVYVDAADPGIVYVSDLGSSNGTWLSGMRLVPLVANVLRVGDVIQLNRDNPVLVEVLP